MSGEHEIRSSGTSSAGLTHRIAEVLNRRPAVGFAAAVVRDGRLSSFVGHGAADLESQRPITEHTVFRIASITKTFTAIAAMQLWERGLVDLDAPANAYLRAYRLVPARPEFGHATLRHLLTHTSGVSEIVRPAQLLRPDFGESVPSGRPVPTLSEYYRGALRTSAEPGTRWIYTDHGFATVGQIVEDVSGMPLAQYLRERIFRPLGMAETDLEPSRIDRGRQATGYTFRSRGARAVTDRAMVTAAASSAYSTVRDMARYLSALTGGGANDHGSVLEPATLAQMFAPQYQPDPRLPGMGLAFFRGELGTHTVFEHQGILPGFNSQIWFAPDARVGVLAFTNGAHQATLWLPAETSALLGDELGVAPATVRTDIPHEPAIWSQICGSYHMRGALTDARARMMVGAGAEVRIRSGRPLLRIRTPIPALLRGLPLHPDDDKDAYAFRIDLSAFGIPSARVVFGTDAYTGSATLHVDLLPMTLYKRR